MLLLALPSEPLPTHWCVANRSAIGMRLALKHGDRVRLTAKPLNAPQPAISLLRVGLRLLDTQASRSAGPRSHLSVSINRAQSAEEVSLDVAMGKLYQDD